MTRCTVLPYFASEHGFSQVQVALPPAKNDDELTRAFEGVLQSMVELDNPKAAVILDEFRVH